MEIGLIREILADRKPGVFTNLVYTVDCPVKSEFKKQGVKVRKTVNTVARFKIKYGNIASVKARKEKEAEVGNEPKKPRANNFVSIVENLLYHNTNTDKDYLNVYTIKNNNTKKLYEVHIPIFGENVWNVFSEEEIREKGFLIDSYFNKSEGGEMFRINAENISSINGRR